MVSYLKRHWLPLTLVQRLLRSVGLRILMEGRKKWEHIMAFYDRLLQTITPVAMGERVLLGWIHESFLLTRGLIDYESRKSAAAKQFVPPLNAELIKVKKAPIEAVAEQTVYMYRYELYNCNIIGGYHAAE